MKPKSQATRMILTVITAILIVTGVSGCMNMEETQKQKQPEPEVVKEHVLAYLKEKYGEEFVPVTYSDSNWAYSYKSMYLYPKNGTKADSFEVRGIQHDDGSYEFSDGYFGKYIADEYSKTVAEIIKGVYKDFKFSVSFGEGVFPDRLNKDTKLEEIYKEGEYFNANIDIFVKEDSAEGIDTENSLELLAAEMIKRRLVSNISIYIVRNEKFDSFIASEAFNAVNWNDYFIGKYKAIMIGMDLKIFHRE